MQSNNNTPTTPPPANPPATTPMNPGGNIVFKDNPKKNTGMIIGMIILALLAAGGIGFGIWGLLSMQKDNETKCASSEKEETSEEIDINVETNSLINEELAYNIVKPYIISLRYGINIFDQEFNETNKAEVAYRNLSNGLNSDWVFYDDFNKEFQYLFGNDEELAKTNYQIGYDILTYIPENNNFKVEAGGGGGTGLYTINIVKNASSNNNDIIIEMYHDNVPICSDDSSNASYCMTNEQYENLESWIAEHQDNIPTYSMTFRINNEHYVLKNISNN